MYTSEECENYKQEEVSFCSSKIHYNIFNENELVKTNETTH